MFVNNSLLLIIWLQGFGDVEVTVSVGGRLDALTIQSPPNCRELHRLAGNDAVRPDRRSVGMLCSCKGNIYLVVTNRSSYWVDYS